MTRRTFVKGLAAGGAVTAAGLWNPAVHAAQARVATGELSNQLRFADRRNTGRFHRQGAHRLYRQRITAGADASLREGDTITLRVHNALEGRDASLHWHGILLPANMDGVPGLSFKGIHPGETFTYRFKVKQHGTYWYHSRGPADLVLIVSVRRAAAG